MKKTLIWVLAVALAVSLFFNGWLWHERVSNEQENVQMANPASAYCIGQGGKLEIRENADGQYGVCILKTGEECEEWEYYRNECPPSNFICEGECGSKHPHTYEYDCMALCNLETNDEDYHKCIIDCTTGNVRNASDRMKR